MTPPKLAVAPVTKFVPVTVSVNAVDPAAIVVGESVVTVGAGLFTWNVTAVAVPPPGAGFVTSTSWLPAAAMSVARIVAVNCVEFTNDVARAM